MPLDEALSPMRSDPRPDEVSWYSEEEVLDEEWPVSLSMGMGLPVVFADLPP